MRENFAKIPAPIAGLGLGLGCLGTVFMNINAIWGNILGILAALVLGIYLLKIIMNFPAFRMDLNHPVFSSIVPTFSMGMMIIGSYLGQINYTIGIVVWSVAIGLHILLLISFLRNILKEKKLQNIIPSYFIPPVGIIVACVCGKIFNIPILCEAIFYFGFISYMIVLPVVIIHLIKSSIPPSKRPTLAIMAAPASLCLAGYLTLNIIPNPIILAILVPLSIGMTVFLYSILFKLLRIPFNPGYSAYTFPLVISAVAILKFAGYLTGLGISWGSYIKALGMIELFIATIIVLYVGIRYLHFYLIKDKRVLLVKVIKNHIKQ